MHPVSAKKHLPALLAVIGFCVMVGLLVSRSNTRSPLYQGKTVKTWLLQLSAPDPKARHEAQAAFQTLGTNAVPELARLVRVEDARWREVMRRIAFRLPRFARTLVLHRVSPPQAALVRPAAARALANLGPRAAAATPELVRALHDKVNGTCWEATVALGRIGGPAVPGLTSALQEEDATVRCAAARGLGEAGPESAPAVPALIQMLTRDSPAERAAAAQSLARIGTPAVAPLINVLVRERGAAREAAAAALLQHYGRPGPHLAADRTSTADETAAAREQAIGVLAASGLANELVTKLLAGAVKDPAPGVRLAALKALAQGHWNLQPALPNLVAGLRDESPMVREWSARALGKIGPPAKAAIPGLTRLVQDKLESVRVAALEALESIKPSGENEILAPFRKAWD